MTSETCCHARVMTAVTEKMATDARKPEIKEMAENSYFLWCTYGRCYRQMRARYRNFVRTLRMHMKLLGFSDSIAERVRLVQ
ncbi:hypothetical protein [Acetobacter persici]|uniref:hypothetical protein n=1 Tax=Acetobacter persici TaxID=1076596 RepID=UPI001BAD9CC8|nr:hypothetical protein [Acetobacter persici]